MSENTVENARTARHFTATRFWVALRGVLGATSIAAGLGSIFACVVLSLCAASGAKLVITNSIPRGLYAPEAGAIVRNVVAGGCMPRAVADKIVRLATAVRGSCPGGVLPFFKIVAAVAGDTVVVSASAVSINGAVWPWSASQSARTVSLRWSSRSRSYVIREGDVLLLGLHPNSFDGRYFGPTPLASLARFRPILIERSAYARTLERILADRPRAARENIQGS